MCLDTQWVAVTFRATFFGPHGLWNNPSGALMPGKVIGFDWTNVLSLLRWELNTSFDAFCFHPQRPWRAAACQALGIPSCHVAEDTHLQHLHENKFSLTPRRIPVERKASADKSRVDLDMVASEESGSEAESGWSGVSDNSSTDSECTNLEASSVASDQDRFDTAYEAFRDLAEGLYNIDLTRYSRGVTSEDAPGVQLLNGQEKLQELVHLPRTWPLARLTIALAGLSKQIDRLLEGYCFQILATNRDPEAHNGKVIQTATHLTWILAEYLRGSCGAFWTMPPRSYSTMTLNHSWHRVFGSCRFIGNCWTAHVASDRALLQKELVVAQVWSRSSVRKTKSREERGSTMLGRLTLMMEGDLPNGLGRAA